MERSKKETQLFLKQLGERIRKLRKEKKMSLRDLGYSCDIEKSNMGRIESGRTNPTILTLKKICKSLGITLKKLMDFEYAE